MAQNTVGSASFKLSADTTDLDRGLDKGGKSIAGFASKFSFLEGVIGGFIGGLGGKFFSGLTDAIEDVFKEAGRAVSDGISGIAAIFDEGQRGTDFGTGGLFGNIFKGAQQGAEAFNREMEVQNKLIADRNRLTEEAKLRQAQWNAELERGRKVNEEANDIIAEQRALLEELKTPMQKLMDEIKRINDLPNILGFFGEAEKAALIRKRVGEFAAGNAAANPFQFAPGDARGSFGAGAALLKARFGGEQVDPQKAILDKLGLGNKFQERIANGVERIAQEEGTPVPVRVNVTEVNP